MKTLATLLVIAALVAVWVVWVRPAIRDKPWAAGFFAKIEPFEIALWKKSETIFWERSKHAFAVALAVLPQIGVFDPTPFIGFIPEKHRWWVILIPSVALALDGLVGEMLRNRTTKPVEVVALPEDKPPEVAAAVARAEAATDRAVVAVETAKATGAV